MLLGFFLLFVCEGTANSTTVSNVHTTGGTPPTTDAAVELPTQVVARPDYPVTAGQRVDLQCSTSITPDLIEWYHLENQTWKTVGSGRDLTLTEPKQSGLYQCCERLRCSHNKSPAHTVYIISSHTTAAEKLGMAGFVFSLLALIIDLAILFWLGYQRPGRTMTSTAAAKGFPGPEKSPKGGLPQADSDVYMNYTNTNQAYSDLDPAKMTGDNVYASLS